MSAGKSAIEVQKIYVTKEDVKVAAFLKTKFNDDESVVRDDPDKDDAPVISDDGIPQKKCPACSEEVDFDYYVCPHCKAKMD